MKVGLALVAVIALACAGEARSLRGGTDYDKCLKAATFTMTDALDKGLAGEEARGTVPVAIEIEEEDGKIIWSMEFAKGEKILEINFDVTSGNRWPLENEDHDKSAEAKAAKVSLKEAIGIATKKIEGQPVEAAIRLKDAKPVCDVKVFTSKKKVVVVTVDALSGEIAMVTKFDPAAKKGAEKEGEKKDRKSEKDEKEDK